MTLQRARVVYAIVTLDENQFLKLLEAIELLTEALKKHE